MPNGSGPGGRPAHTPTSWPILQVVRGHPNAEELAAVTAALAARLATVPPPRPATRRVSGWTDRSRLLRTMPAPGPGAWRRSGLPR